jgi:alpha-tubulin suppressor-like RCC1 family protein
MPIADAIEIGGAEFSHCAIRADRSLWCWGSTASMLFSQRASPEDVAPTRVPVGGEVATMSIVRDVICVVRTNGTVACWGNNDDGQLGDGTFMPRTRAADVVGIRDAVDVAVGFGVACAVHRDGGVSCWGAADRGQLGTYVMIDVATPVSVVWP